MIANETVETVEYHHDDATRRSVRIWKNRIEVDLTVRPYTHPLTGATRYTLALLADNDTRTDYGTEASAIAAYEGLVHVCEADYARDGEHAWHVTDVAGVPVIEPDTDWELPAPRRMHSLATRITVEVEARYEPGTEAFYGWPGARREPVTVCAAWCEGDEVFYEVENPAQEYWTASERQLRATA